MLRRDLMPTRAGSSTPRNGFAPSYVHLWCLIDGTWKRIAYAQAHDAIRIADVLGREYRLTDDKTAPGAGA